ncbi:MAG: hypothetical protein LCH26_01495 [Proteobacteria bacterium]|nr:hypothetical protein [Pseudomonadota bacterium]
MKKILLGTAFAVALTTFAGQASASLSSLWGDVADDGQVVVTPTSASFNSTNVDNSALDALLGGAGTTAARITTAKTLSDGGNDDLVTSLTNNRNAIHAGSVIDIEQEIILVEDKLGTGYIIGPYAALPTDLYGKVDSTLLHFKAQVALLAINGGDNDIHIGDGAAGNAGSADTIKANVAGAATLKAAISALLG